MRYGHLMQPCFLQICFNSVELMSRTLHASVIGRLKCWEMMSMPSSFLRSGCQDGHMGEGGGATRKNQAAGIAGKLDMYVSGHRRQAVPCIPTPRICHLFTPGVKGLILPWQCQQLHRDESSAISATIGSYQERLAGWYGPICKQEKNVKQQRTIYSVAYRTVVQCIPTHVPTEFAYRGRRDRTLPCHSGRQ